MTNEITDQQAEQLMREFEDSKVTHQSFFKDVVVADDTTKVGNLSIEELGEPHLEQRGIKELELFCRDVYKDESFADFFKKMAEIQTSTSLSREGFLMRLFVTSKKEMSDTTVQEKKKNSGWFKKS